MGRRGPRPTPTVLKILRGNPSQEPLARIQAAAPKSPPAGQEAPPDLDGVALERWRESVPILSTMRVWDEAARETWARYCRLYALWRECHDIVRRQGQTYEKPSGMIAARPEAALLLQYSAQLIRLEVEFGMTPSSRAGAATIRDEETDPMAEFLRGAGP
jgi:P27 family predicted phage terminase small subunit